MEDVCESPAGTPCGKSRSILQVRVKRHKEEAKLRTDLKSVNLQKEFALRVKRGAHYNREPRFLVIFALAGAALAIGTAVHERVIKLCESLNFREWSGYYAASVYEMHHEHEYNAIRNAAALIDVTPLFKYRITGKDATKFVNRVITRDIN